MDTKEVLDIEINYSIEQVADDKTSNEPSFQVEMGTTTFTQCLVQLDEQIEAQQSQWDQLTTMEQVKDLLCDLIEKVQSKSQMLDQRFDQSNTDRQLSFNLSFDPKSILSTGRKTSFKKNVSFLPPPDQKQQSGIFNQFSSSFFDSPEMKKPRTKSPACTPHHLQLPLFHQSRSLNSSDWSPSVLPSSERMNSSKASSVEDFVDALETTEFGNEDDIKSAMERSKLTDIGMSLCSIFNETDTSFQAQQRSFVDDGINKSTLTEFSPFKSITVKHDQSDFVVYNQSRQELEELMTENQRLRQELERAQNDILHQNERFQSEIDQRETNLKALTEKNNELKQHAEQVNLQSENFVQQHLKEVEQHEHFRRRLETEQTELTRKITDAAEQIHQYKRSIEANEQLMKKFNAAVQQNQEKDALIRSISIENQSLLDKLKDVTTRLADTELQSNAKVRELCEQQKAVENAHNAALDNLEQQKNEELQKSKEEYSSKIAELKCAIAELQKHLDQTIPKKYFEQLQQELNQERDQLANYVTEIRVLKQENADLVQKNEEILQNVICNQLNDVVNAVQFDLDLEKVKQECEKELMELALKLQVEVKQQKEMTEVIAKKTAEIDELQRLNEDVRHEMKALMNGQTSMKEESFNLIASLRNEIYILEKIRDDEKRTHIQLRTDIENSFAEQLRVLQDQLSEQIAVNKSFGDSKDKLDNERKSLVNELTELAIQFNKSKEENQVLKSAVKNSQFEMANILCKIKEGESRIEILSSGKQDVELENQKLVEELDKIRQQMEQRKTSYNDDITTLNNRIVELNKERNSQVELNESQTSQLKSQILDLEKIRKEEQNSHQQALSNLIEEKKALEAKMDDLQKTVDNSVPMQQLEELQGKLTKSEQLLASQSDELKQLSNRFEEKMKDVEQRSSAEKQRLQVELEQLRSQFKEDQKQFKLKTDELINKYESQLAVTAEKHQQLMSKCSEEHVREKNFLEVNILALKNELAVMQQISDAAHGDFESKLKLKEEELSQSRHQEQTLKQLAEKNQHTATDLNEKLNHLHAEIKKMFTQEQIDELNQQLANAKAMYSKQLTEKQTVLDSKLQIEAEFVAVQEQSQQLMQRIDKLNTENQILSQQVVGLLEFEKRSASLENELKVVVEEKERNRIAVEMMNQHTSTLNETNKGLRSANEELFQKLESIKLDNRELLAKFCKFEENSELLEAELKMERNENIHLMQQVKLAKQLKGHSEKEKKHLVSQINNFINSQSNDQQEMFDFLLALKDKLSQEPNEGVFKRPSGKAFLQSLVKKPLNSNN